MQVSILFFPNKHNIFKDHCFDLSEYVQSWTEKM